MFGDFYRIIAVELGDIFHPSLSLESNCCAACLGFFAVLLSGDLICVIFSGPG